MKLANPAGLFLLALGIPVVALHMLRPRRPPVEVASTFLWREVTEPVSSATPWQPLRVTLPLVLQLLAVALLAVAAARPARTVDVPLERHTVFLVDASASMAASEGRPDRLGDAKAQAKALRRRIPSGGSASVVVLSSRPRVVLSSSPDAGAFDAAVDAIATDGGHPDVAASSTLAASLETPGAPVGFLLLSDGGIERDERRRLPPGTRYVRIGRGDGNQAITRVTLEPRGSGLHARVTVANPSRTAAERTLRVDVDGRTEHTSAVRLEPGASTDREIDLPSGERVTALLDGADLLRSDDRGVAVAQPRAPVRVLVAGEPNPFLDALLAAVPGVTVERSPVARPAEGFGLAVYDGVAVPDDPAAPFLAIAPPAGIDGLVPRDTVERPAVTLVRSDDPLLAGLDLSDVAIADAQRVDASRDEVLLAGAASEPLLVRGTRRGRPFAYLTFALQRSNLPLQLAFPILGDRLVTSLTGAAEAPPDLRAGAPLPVTGPARLHAPDGTSVTLAPGEPAPPAWTSGFWRVAEAGRPERTLAVNPDPRESNVAPAARVEAPAATGRAGGRRSSGEAPLLGWVAAALLALLGAEHLVTRRRTGVPQRQRRAAVAVRAGISVALVAAAAGAALPRPATRVATMFLIDASDSMGAAGREAAAEAVREALRTQPRGALAGVALFGGDARLELTMQERARLDQPAVRIDPTRTDLSGALRLAAAVLPADARRRIVLVSDGRPTTGDALAEARRLRAQGVRVDVIPVARAGDTDAAVVRLTGPAIVREGESFTLRATLAATAAGHATLVLRRDGTVVDERAVDLAAGETAVEIAQPPADPGLHRFAAELRMTGDRVPHNDTGTTAVRVRGPEAVLVAEGASGAARALAEALRASGVRTDVIAAGELPPLDTLSTYAATVLVDVDARSLSSEQVDALGASTRDLGRGLVAIGGERSFALGGYLGSALEKLLPVTSEVTDPKRRSSVAEVLAIDSSGSMSACHCNPGGPTGFGGDRRGGGVNKTDISKAAAARAIRALHRSDQVGVLAFNTEQRWIVPLQQLPSEDVVDKGLSSLEPAGGTNLQEPLRVAGDALKEAKAKLKHIILFTDGWTNQSGLAGQAAALREEGITVSVLATGEGPGEELKQVAEAGGGRFYPGTDLERIPEIMMQEAVLASRSFVNEGEFYPRVVGSSEATDDLASSPPVLGYLAATSKTAATTLLDVGDEHDPLLATWRIGLGRSTAWLSDASARWSQRWAAWERYPSFWAAVVKETFASGEASAVHGEAAEDDLRITVERETPWPDGSTAIARVAAPNGSTHEVPLERTSATTFGGTAPASVAGTYGIGAQVEASGATVSSASAIVTRSYPPEYRIGQAQPDLLERISLASGGRGTIEPARAFDAAGLVRGRGRVPLAGWLLLAAALLWPLDVALRRLAFHGTGRATAAAAVRRAIRIPRRAPRGRGPVRAPAPEPPDTVRRLLERKEGG